MGYYVQRRNGELVPFEDNIPEDVAMAQVRRMDGVDGVSDGNFFGDLNEYLQEGVGAGISALGQGITLLDPSATSSRRRGEVPIGDQLSRWARDYGEEHGTNRLSPEALAARHEDSAIYNEDTGINWRNIGGTAVSSAPLLAATIGTGGAAGLARAGPATQATVAAATEGALAAGSVADSIDESIRDIAAFDPETFIASDLGQQALAETDGNYARAVELAANRAKGLAPLAAGALTAGVGRFAGINPFSSVGRQSLGRAILSGALRESGEEAVQSSGEAIATNIGVGEIDPERGPFDDVLESAALGAITAAPIGGAFAGVQQLASRRPPPASGPAAIQGPVMPPEGHPNRGPASGNGNPPGWTPPDTEGAEDAEFSEANGNILPGQTPPQPKDQPGVSAEDATARAQDYARNFDGEAPITDPADDELYAGALAEQFQSLGMAAREAPPKKKGVRRTVEPVPLYRFNREALEADDADAAAIYAGAVERAMADGLDVGEALRSTATFNVYKKLDESLFADVENEADPAGAAGYGLKITDSDGTVSFLDIGAKTLEEAQASSMKFGFPPDQKAAPAADEPKEAVSQEVTPPPEIKQPDPVATTGTEIEPKGTIKNLRPAANEALKAYRTKGEQGLQSYLGGLNITASKSLLRALGGQPARTDKMPETKGAILRRVRQMTTSADKRGLPTNASLVNDNISPAEDAANQQISDKEFFGEDWPNNTNNVVAPESKETKIPEAKPLETETKASVKKPLDAKPDNVTRRAEEPEIAEMPKREARSAGQIKALLRDIAALEETAYDDALPKMKITPEEAVVVREAMKADKGLDNLRSTFNDVLASQRKTRKSKQTETPKVKSKATEPKVERAESPERVRKQRETADRTLAREMSRGMPKDYDVVRRSVEQWLEVERDRQGIRNDDRWFKQWPLSRQEALIARVWDGVSGQGAPMFSKADASKPIQSRDLPVTNKKWVNEMERAIKAAAACAASAGASGLGPVVAAVTGLGLGALASAPIAAILAEEGYEQTRFNEMFDQVSDFRREAGLASANDYLDESANYVAPSFDEDGFIQPEPPEDEVYSAAELRAAAADISNVPASLITQEDIRRQAYIRRHGLRRHINDLNAQSEPRQEERIRIPE